MAANKARITLLKIKASEMATIIGKKQVQSGSIFFDLNENVVVSVLFYDLSWNFKLLLDST